MSKLWKNFTSQIGNLTPVTNVRLYEIFTDWLKSNKKYFQPGVWTDYQLEWYCKQNPGEYASEYSQTEPAEEIGILLKSDPSSSDQIAMFIRDCLWDIIAYKIDYACIRCNDGDMRVLTDPAESSLIFACDLCGWAQYQDGTPWKGEPVLRPAKKKLLKEGGLLD